MSELAGIGEMVPQDFIQHMNDFITIKGEDLFISMVYCGTFSEVAYAYIYPCNEMRATENFEFIQRAFINAYV